MAIILEDDITTEVTNLRLESTTDLRVGIVVRGLPQVLRSSRISFGHWVLGM